MLLHTRRKLLVGALALAGLGAVSTTAMAAPATGSMVQIANAMHLHKGDTVLGSLTSAQPMHVVIALKLRNHAKLKSFIASVRHSQVPLETRYMSRAQFMAQHAPTQDQADAVASFLKQAGFSNVTIADNRMLVSGDASPDLVSAAFNTKFASVRTHKGRMAYANTSAIHIPGTLKNSVLSVIGLQNVHMAHTVAHAVQPQATTQAVTGHNPTDFSGIYGGTGVATGAGVTVGIITSGSLTQTITDLNTFTSNNGLATVTTQTVNTNGTSTDTSGVDEWNLDSQDLVGAAGGEIGKIIFYNIPSLSNANLTADINKVVSDNNAKIINVSLGECETTAQGDGSAAAQDQAFQQAVAQGQTFSVSTGDSGADECGNGGTTPSWPAASQYVVAVAGTTLDASGSSYNSETVWSKSGGSESTFEPKPSWQSGVYSGTYRGVADVAFDGDPNSGAQIIVNGSTTQVGGTSLSAPIFAGLWARVIAVKGTSVGFAAPLLYNLPASDFHDVTSGNNGGSTASTGYDLASGRGSLILSSAINDIGSSSGGGSGGSGGGTAAQLLSNTGFESGTASPWTMSSGTLCSSTSCSGQSAHAGTYFAWLDGYGSSHTDSMSQSVSIPSGDTSATLDFFMHIDTAETTSSTAYDTLKVQVYNTSGTLLGTVASFSNLDAASGYVEHTADLSAYIGQSVVVKFTGTEDSSNQTSFVLDDINLNAQ
ncbi:protease pro-enzyme activation domain-containing protein [Gallaecimonas sp. GXIMD1310]|uniref:S53 family peptidase n=1 Tax=Gallaecimonas sp. GXIMD1310 TaxID=3131926 RepID=UPI0032568F70